MSLSWRLARRDLRGGLGGFRIFLACLALGVGVIAAIGSLRGSIEEGLAREGAVLLGGDAEMEFTYRFADAAERDWMNENAVALSEVAEFRSMAVVGEDRALTQIKAVDDAYPLVGRMQLTPDIPLDEDFSNLGVLGDPTEPLLQAALDDMFGRSSKRTSPIPMEVLSERKAMLPAYQIMLAEQ